MPAIAAFVAVPIMVRRLSRDADGLMAVAAALTGYLELARMDLAQSLVHFGV